MNRLDQARAYHAHALSLYEALDHEEGMADSWNNLGVVAMRMGDIGEARALLTKAYDARKDTNGQGALAQILSDLGDLAMHEATSRWRRSVMRPPITSMSTCGIASRSCATA